MQASDRFSLLADIVARLRPRRLIELGCGGGAAAERIALRLPKLRYTGVDRSELAIARAIKRNQSLVQAGAAEFVCADFRQLREGRFDLCCAVNLNSFWTDPARSFSCLPAVMTKASWLVLVFDAPGADKARSIVQTLLCAAPAPFAVEDHIRLDATIFAITYRLDPGRRSSL